MKLLLDTHVLLWALEDSPRLPFEIREEIISENNEVYVSVASLWEIAIKHATHPENVEFTGKEMSAFCREAGFHCLEVKDRHVFALETLQRPEDAPRHNDPFDRILVSQAKAENMVFLTHDSLIPYYGERCIMSV